MLKEISEPFFLASSVSVSGATFTSSNSSVKYKDSINYQVNFTGTLGGIMQVNVSSDYTPGLPQSGQNTMLFSTVGTWATISSTAVGGGTTSPVVFQLNQVAAPWTQFQYVANSGSGGVISVIFNAKSLG